LLTESDDLHSVATSKGARLVGVDTRGVGEEVLVDVESDIDGTESLNLVLDGSLTGTIVGRRELVVGVVLSGDSAVISTSGLGSTSRGVGNTGVGTDSSVNKELHGDIKVSSVATEVTSITRNHVLSRELEVGGSSRGDASTIRSDLRGGKCPARSTMSLVKNVANTVSTVGPDVTSISGIVAGGSDEGVAGKVGRGHEATKHLAGLTEGHSLEDGVASGSPGGTVGRVDLVDHGVIENGGIKVES
jgi:hypothetical protein